MPAQRKQAMSLGVVSFVLLSSMISSSLADLAAFEANAVYDKGALGSYPIQSYVTSDIQAPHVNIAMKNSKCDDGMYTFLSPRGNSVDKPGPMILDAEGNLVWTQALLGQTYNAMVQEYKGQQFLTYWLGNDAVAGHGAGKYYMLDSSYNQVASFGAANNLDGDLHEFRFTPDGTALLTVYQVIEADLSAFHGKSRRGYIWDGIFQEIDLATGSLLFQWRASDHYNVTDSYHQIGNGGWSSDAFDFFHINSVEKDDKGNYLVSSRYMHSVTYIDGNSGAVIWVLGGRRNMFKDLSNGKATSFAWQHDARWHDDYTTITLFDNGAESGHYTADHSRGLKIKLDFKEMTATVVTEYIHPLGLTSSSQGSVQVLPSGNVLVGYGFDGAYAEYSSDGQALCDVHFGAASRFESGDVQSYRVLKFNWVGRPSTKPEVRIANGILYVSWNGATEVQTWVVQDSDAEAANANSFWSVAALPKNGFETQIQLGELDRSVKAYLRVVAMDAKGSILGTSLVIPTGAKNMHEESGLRFQGLDTKPIVFFIVAVSLASLYLIGWCIMSRLRISRMHLWTRVASDDEEMSSSQTPLIRQVLFSWRRRSLQSDDESL